MRLTGNHRARESGGPTLFHLCRCERKAMWARVDLPALSGVSGPRIDRPRRWQIDLA